MTQAPSPNGACHLEWLPSLWTLFPLLPIDIVVLFVTVAVLVTAIVVTRFLSPVFSSVAMQLKRMLNKAVATVLVLVKVASNSSKATTDDEAEQGGEEEEEEEGKEKDDEQKQNSSRQQQQQQQQKQRQKQQQKQQAQQQQQRQDRECDDNVAHAFCKEVFGELYHAVADINTLITEYCPSTPESDPSLTTVKGGTKFDINTRATHSEPHETTIHQLDKVLLDFLDRKVDDDDEWNNNDTLRLADVKTEIALRLNTIAVIANATIGELNLSLIGERSTDAERLQETLNHLNVRISEINRGIKALNSLM